ncbi:PIG-L family deacetylase [Candidatus Woesearchaeota archaeon]|jgi:N-acetylglucosamine malate deacetylase 1|nr:PIG-L family deacetylase [Candidatus Woesearchaeota archaeon]
MEKQETILVLGAHSDDFVIGAGGTIAKYAAEGKKIIAYSFSYGELSHPWLKEKVAKKMRVEEAYEAAEVLDCSLTFLDLKEGKYMDKKDEVITKLKTLCDKEKPTKIFTHTIEDPHRDHKVVHTITMELWKQLKNKPEVYVYSVWNPISLKTDYPSLYVNIRKTFGKKLASLKKFESQKYYVTYPTFLLLFRAFQEGLTKRMLLAERFFRVK